MLRYVFAGLLVVAMAGVAWAEHKITHDPGGDADGIVEPAATP